MKLEVNISSQKLPTDCHSYAFKLHSDTTQVAQLVVQLGPEIIKSFSMVNTAELEIDLA